MVEALRKLKAFGILVDEVTDILVKEQLIVFAQCVSDDDSSSANAETITKCISNNLDKCELHVQKVMSLVCDGTKVMTGKRTGVAA